MTWSLYENDQLLAPLKFSNGKSQEDVVKEVISATEEGYKIIFIKGVCGTGKSAIALNLAKHFGKTSIVVPIKSLQEQYIKDYAEKKYILKDNKKLKISSILGRKNFSCKFLEEKPSQRVIREKDTKISDIFAGIKPINEEDNSADNKFLPCKIEIKDKNSAVIKDYIKQNPSIKNSNFNSINEVKRMSIAPTCPYWSPILPDEYDIKKFQDSKKFKYKGMNNIGFTIFQRKPGCKYYGQYHAYDQADVIIFNSLKYKLETLMDRKPETELEIIDECDEFLDSFANQERISLNRLSFALNTIFSESEETKKILSELTDITNTIRRKYLGSNEIFKVSGTIIEDLIKTLLQNDDFLKETEIDESNYLFQVDEISRIFYDFLDETYFSAEKIENDINISLITTNLKKRFKELTEKNKIIVMMSGTIHSDYVLRNIYNLENFKIIDAEISTQGNLIKLKNGYELDCKYANFQSGKISREGFLKTFSKTIESAKPPTLVHLTSFQDLPTELEKESYNLVMPTQNEIKMEQNADPMGNRIQEFKDKKFPVLYTTRCNRGIDFPGETCNSIIISRFPYPNISSLFWKILKKTNPEHFMSFYMDKAKRELTQKIYRGLRSKEDKVYLLSPDIRVLGFEL
ncbi:MAG TPA: helicase C-terminal domain-containing protein [Candidatus Pacearchaeota archaeon]|jgi:Rad3-related DNA helicase|nr:helicase C-terminal domain-containing protein [Candidatus Pacearchaeota archaeon]